MSEEQEIVYQEGYNAFLSGEEELSTPYRGIDAEFWSDGFEDAKEDTEQRSNNSD